MVLAYFTRICSYKWVGDEDQRYSKQKLNRHKRVNLHALTILVHYEIRSTINSDLCSGKPEETWAKDMHRQFTEEIQTAQKEMKIH